MPINMPMPQGEWLDNLIFIRHMLLGDLEASVLLPGIEEEIRRLVRAVYGDELQSAHIFSDLWEAWQLRCRDPLLRLDPDLDDRLLLDEEDFAEANRIKNIRPSKAAHRFDHSYHEAAVIRRWFQTVVIETLGLVPAVWLRRLQEQTINHLNKSGVAIETMLTSNVLISCYENYSEHHILRWLGLRGDGPRPIVCVASDNPGIFVTNMRNEFMHLHRILIEEGLSREEAVARLQVLNRNGRTYAFLTSD